MPLAVEDMADALIAYLFNGFESALAEVAARTDSRIPLSPPPRERYFLGAPGQYTSYMAPSVFIITQRTRRPGEANVGHNTVLSQQHSVVVDILVEGMTTEADLQRQCWRYAEAADMVLRDADIFTDTTQRSTKTFVNNIEYGAFFLNTESAQRRFRSDVWLDVRVDHNDQRTPMGVVPGLTAASETTSTVVVRVVDSVLTTTVATNILQTLPTGSGGNYLLNLYYRVVTAATDVTLTAVWSDASGSQTITPVVGSSTVGAHSVTPIYFTATAAGSIALTATAGTANQVYISATLEQL